MKRTLFFLLFALFALGTWATSTVVVGSQAGSSNSLPYDNNYKHSTTEVIYHPEELGGGGTITAIAYNVVTAESFMCDIQIYMGHRSSATFSGTSDYVPSSVLTQVYAGSVTLGEVTGWETQTLSTPFVYNGSDQLVVVITKTASSYTNTLKYATTTNESGLCLCRHNDSSADYADITNTNRAFSTSSSRPVTQFTFNADRVFPTSGSCGDNLTWQYADGVLTISGTGEMTNHSWSIYSSSITSIVWNVTNCASPSTSSNAPFYSIRENITNFTIGEEVTTIPAYLCYGMSGLTSITIPNSVTSIGNAAFYGCSALTSVTIPNSVTSIGNSAFSGCSGLTSVTIPNSVTSIGSSAFRGCSGLTSVTIPNSVTSIGSSAFYGCSGLTSITIPEGVTSIGSEAFRGCSGLTSITIPNSVTSIGNYAFYGCSGLTSVTIPNSVTNIGGSAFYRIPNIIYSGTATGSPWGAKSINGFVDGYLVYADATKTNLLACSSSATGEIIIPNSVTSIGSSAFYGCSGLTSVTIPNSVTSIGSDAFYRCSGLTSVTIPNSVTSISNSAFSGCSALTSVTIPNSVTNIGGSAFSGCTGLTSITIPSSVTSIGSSAFHGCSGLISAGPIGGGYSYEFGWNDSIPSYAFYNCTGLTSITIPSSVTSIGRSAFHGCSGLISAGPIGGGYSYEFGWNDSIPSYAFRDCSGLTSITIPSSVTSIGNYAFYGCSALTSVTIPNSVTSIGNHAFYNCSGLTSVIWNSSNFISPNNSSDAPFYEVRSRITSFAFGDSVTLIPAYLCYGMSGLTSITIPNSVTSIGSSAFRGCSALTSVTIPNSVTNIGNSVFKNCSRLTSIVWNAINCAPSSSDLNAPFYDVRDNITNFTIGGEVTTIPEYLCYGMSGLTSVTIPNSVTSIGDSTFYNCTNLKTVFNNSNLNIIKGSDTHGYVAYYANNIYIVRTIAEVNAMERNVETTIKGVVNYVNGRNLYIQDASGGILVYLSDIPNNAVTAGKEVVISGTTTIYGGAPELASASIVLVSEGTPFPFVTKTLAELCAKPIKFFCQRVRVENITIARYNSYNYPYVTDGTNTIQCYKMLLNPLDFPVGTKVRVNAIAGYYNAFQFVGDAAGIERIFAVNVNSIDGGGVVNGNGEYPKDSLVNISASPAYGYHFVQWNDGNTDNPRMFAITCDTTLTAEFAKNQYTITTLSTTGGSINSVATAMHEDVVTLKASPATGYHFSRWSDGNTDNPRSFVITCDTTFKAEFAKNSYEITTSAATSGGTTTGDTIALYEERVTISATADYGYYFYAWQDGNSTNPRTITVTENKEYSATFRKQNFTISVATDNSTMGTVSGGGSTPYQEESTISANARFGYEFTQWNDGNTANPRSILVESDSSFVAYFRLQKSGECGANLTWRYADGTLYISGTGAMSDYTSTTMPWLLLRDSIEVVSIDNGVTSIGDYAFYGCQNRAFRTLTMPQSIVTIGNYAFANCNRLTSINFSNDMEEVGDYAFSGCTRINDMTIYATITPDAFDHTFDGVNRMAYLYVQQSSVRTYKLDPIWGVFDVQSIGASTADAPVTGVQVEPYNNEAVFTWPTDNAAASYALQITKDGVVFCTLTFNANGQLTGLAFAPGRDGAQHAPAAEMTANGGMSFTVTGLNSATAYAFTFETKDATQQVIASYAGNFATAGYVEQGPGTPTALEDLASPTTGVQKIFRDGQVLILRDGVIYDTTGRMVEK